MILRKSYLSYSLLYPYYREQYLACSRHQTNMYWVNKLNDWQNMRNMRSERTKEMCEGYQVMFCYFLKYKIGAPYNLVLIFIPGLSKKIKPCSIRLIVNEVKTVHIFIYSCSFLKWIISLHHQLAYLSNFQYFIACLYKSFVSHLHKYFKSFISILLYVNFNFKMFKMFIWVNLIFFHITSRKILNLQKHKSIQL